MHEEVTIQQVISEGDELEDKKGNTQVNVDSDEEIERAPEETTCVEVQKEKAD